MPSPLAGEGQGEGELALTLDRRFNGVYHPPVTIQSRRSGMRSLPQKGSFPTMKKGEPKTPRAIYFNDDVYVGWVNHGQFIEIAEVDPEKGPVFYTLSQEYDRYPPLKTETEQCLVCHDTFQTNTPVPRLLVLSVLPNPAGNALKAAALITNDQSPMQERWGGWYVTGTHGKQQHLGNTIVRSRAEDIDEIKNFIARMDLKAGANVTGVDHGRDARNRSGSATNRRRHSAQQK